MRAILALALPDRFVKDVHGIEYPMPNLLDQPNRIARTKAKDAGILHTSARRQGEIYFQAKLRPDFHRYTSAVLNWLEKRPEIDADRIGIIGRSLGGFYAIHSAAHDPRFKACVCWGVLFDLSYVARTFRPRGSRRSGTR